MTISIVNSALKMVFMTPWFPVIRRDAKVATSEGDGVANNEQKHCDPKCSSWQILKHKSPKLSVGGRFIKYGEMDLTIL